VLPPGSVTAQASHKDGHGTRPPMTQGMTQCMTQCLAKCNEPLHIPTKRKARVATSKWLLPCPETSRMIGFCCRVPKPVASLVFVAMSQNQPHNKVFGPLVFRDGYPRLPFVGQGNMGVGQASACKGTPSTACCCLYMDDVALWPIGTG